MRSAASAVASSALGSPAHIGSSAARGRGVDRAPAVVNGVNVDASTIARLSLRQTIVS